MMKICIDAGHYGNYNQSPCNKNYFESKMTWKLHLYLKKELEKRGFQVVTTRDNQAKDLELTARGRKSKGCNLFLSLHSNATSDVSSNYSLACCMVDDRITGIDEISIQLGKQLADVVTKVMTGKENGGRTWRRQGNGGTDYYGVLRGAKAVGTPAILLEHGFHTNQGNVNFLLDESNLEKIAIAEADVIAEFFKVSEKPATNYFIVRILDDALNIRKTPGMDGEIVGCIKDHMRYTIVETAVCNGVEWGRLKSGAGWISLRHKYVEKC